MVKRSATICAQASPLYRENRGFAIYCWRRLSRFLALAALLNGLVLPLNFGGEVFRQDRPHPQPTFLLN
jgi:hypothetical protein